MGITKITGMFLGQAIKNPDLAIKALGKFAEGSATAAKNMVKDIASGVEVKTAAASFGKAVISETTSALEQFNTDLNDRDISVSRGEPPIIQASFSPG